MVRAKASARILVQTTRTLTRSLRSRPAIHYAEARRGRLVSARGRGAGRQQARQQRPELVLESTEVSVTTAEAVTTTRGAGTSTSSSQGLPAAVMDAALVATEAIAAGVPVTGGGHAFQAAADVAEDLPPLVDTSACQDLDEEARKKGTSREIPVTATHAERDGRHEPLLEEEEGMREEDMHMEGPADVTLGEETGSKGGGSKGGVGEEFPVLETPATPAKDEVTTKARILPAATGEGTTGGSSETAGRWALRSHAKAPGNEEREIEEVQEQETRRVKVRMDGNEVTYDINTSAPLGNMFALFCKRVHLPDGGVTFCNNGHVLRGNQSVKDAKLANGSIIEGYIQKLAG
ncbi:hypothetical protein CLOM_g3996 [Closterium sp. NIES-68]|nr:hypothetical protein CLOM_g3996 [Closterium sp. NIES-68]GJP83233.1 hypothetical protein CLOP_g13409 [Closterium sp. NIES-67]